LDEQAQAVSKIQGSSELDREIASAANRRETELDEIIEK
jgi:hypothetical protein